MFVKLRQSLSRVGESMVKHYSDRQRRRAARKDELARKGAKRTRMLRVFAVLSATALVLLVGGALAGVYMIWRLSNDLPDYDHLARVREWSLGEAEDSDG